MRATHQVEIHFRIPSVAYRRTQFVLAIEWVSVGSVSLINSWAVHTAQVSIHSTFFSVCFYDGGDGGWTVFVECSSTSVECNLRNALWIERAQCDISSETESLNAEMRSLCLCRFRLVFHVWFKMQSDSLYTYLINVGRSHGGGHIRVLCSFNRVNKLLLVRRLHFQH